MNENKLYAVEITYKAYVFVGSPFEAEDFISEIIDNEDPIFEAHAVEKNVLGWNEHALVYHDETEDLPLKDVLVAQTH